MEPRGNAECTFSTHLGKRRSSQPRPLSGMASGSVSTDSGADGSTGQQRDLKLRQQALLAIAHHSKRSPKAIGAAVHHQSAPQHGRQIDALSFLTTYTNVERHANASSRDVIAMHKHESALIALMGMRTLPNAMEEVARSPMAQYIISLAIKRRLIDPIEGSNLHRFRVHLLYDEVYRTEEICNYVSKIKQNLNGHLDPCCLAAMSNYFLEEDSDAGEDPTKHRDWKFIAEAVMDAVLAVLFERNDIPNYVKNVKLLQFHMKVWPADVFGVIQLIRHEETLKSLQLSHSAMSQFHFQRGCYCMELIDRVFNYVLRGEGVPPALVQLMQAHMPTTRTNMNLAAVASGYYRGIGKPGWLQHSVPPFCPQRCAGTMEIGRFRFNLAYVGKQEASEFVQMHSKLPENLHIFMIAEQEGPKDAFSRDPKIDLKAAMKSFLDANGDAVDPSTIQIFCVATLAGFLELRDACLATGVITERSPWGVLELTVTSQILTQAQATGGLGSSESLQQPTVPSINIRALYLSIEISTFAAAEQLHSAASIIPAAFHLLGLHTRPAKQRLENLAVTCIPVDKPHLLEGLFENLSLWPELVFFRAINCNLQTMNVPFLANMPQDRCAADCNYQGCLNILNLSNDNFAKDTFDSVGPLLTKLFRQIRDVSLRFCNLQEDVLLGILELAFRDSESVLQYLSLDGNENMRDATVFDKLYDCLTEMELGYTTKLERLSVTNISFSAKQETQLNDFAKRRNAAAKQALEEEVASAEAHCSFLGPVVITRMDQPTSNTTAIPSTRCYRDTVNWFNSIPKNKNFRGHYFEIILS